MFDKETALENSREKLHRQQEALQSTLAEIEYIQKTRPELAGAIKALKVKRDRQALAIKATEQLIELYATPDPRQLTIPDTEKNKKR